jgi:mono/diheme cytochrome c family protein
MRSLFRAFVFIVLVLLLFAAVVVVPIVERGVSARDEPTWIEAAVARQVRHLAIPRAARTQPNPVKSTPEVVAEARAHFADHCASCHANNGSGDTEIGKGLYPRAPDMRLAATQDLSDGELFSIIEGGIRLTGMPAWSTGTPEGARQSWGLVHFIRRLPTLTPQEIAEMEALNPKGPAELQREHEIEKFLNEGKSTP